MQVTETSTDGLKRELRVVLEASEINERFTSRLDEIKGQVELKGFRKGKVPMAHLKKVYGRQVMVEVLEKAVDETTKKVIGDRNERPAMQPDVKLPEEPEEIEKVLAGNSDLSYDVKFEVLPEIKVADFKELALEKLTADVADTEVDEAIDKLAERGITYEVEDGLAAGDGDQVKIDFVGTIDGEAFDGGTAEDVDVVIGQGGFIPGFEEGLAGAKAGDERTITANFPEAYPVAELAGKAANFDVKVKGVAKPVKPVIDDEFSKTLGAENLDNLKDLVRQQIQTEYENASKSKLKSQILDELEKAHDFILPPTLVDREFEGMWAEMTERLERSGKTIGEEGKSEDELRQDYRKLAERRVRLGLLIGEIGDKNEVQVSQEELKRAVLEQTRQFPGQEKAVLEYYEKNPSALLELRAPIFEDKVIDFITELAKPAEKKVSRDELFAPNESDNSEAPEPVGDAGQG